MATISTMTMYGLLVLFAVAQQVSGECMAKTHAEMLADTRKARGCADAQPTSCTCVANGAPKHDCANRETTLWESDGKQCVTAYPDQNTGIGKVAFDYPGNYGESCGSTDTIEPGSYGCTRVKDTAKSNASTTVYKEHKFELNYEGYNMKWDSAGWCTKQWCYVDPCTCNKLDMVTSSWFAAPGDTDQNTRPFYSYSQCGAPDEYTVPQCDKSVTTGDCSQFTHCKWVAADVSSTSGITCMDAKNAYKKNMCCGNPNAEFDENDLYPAPAADCVGYGMNMITLDASQTEGMKVPTEECYYPVTLQVLLDAGEEHYTYIGQTHTNEHAPDGAFVYKMADGSLRYKKVEIVATCDGASLCFSCDHTMGRMTTFAEATLLSKAMTCSSDVISADALKGTYSHYAWLQMPGQGCGSFVYQRPGDMPLVHKTCG